MKRAIYRHKEYKAGVTIDIEDTYPTQFGDGLTRKRKKDSEGTPEAMQAYNDELATRKLTRIINTNFEPEDWFITLHYERQNRPKDYKSASGQLSGFMKKLKQLFIKSSIEFKYVKCTAFGERGGVHHHVILPKGVKQGEISALWKEYVKASIKARPPSFVALYDSGDYSSLAAYIIQQNQVVNGNERYIKKWITSRNLKKVAEPKVYDVEAIKWQEPPKDRDGYFVDKDSIRAGVNPINGRPYLFYRLVKLPPNFVCYDDNNNRIFGSEAIKYFRKQNREFIRKNWVDLNSEGEIVFKDEGIRQNE